MVRDFNVDRATGKRRNVFGKADVTHELREPRPHGKAVEFTKKRGMMKADPPNGALFNGTRKRCGRRGCPVVRGIVELNEKLIVRKIFTVDRLSVFDVVDLK